VVKLDAHRTEVDAPTLRHVRDDVCGAQEWEFMCECGHDTCHETVLLTLDAFEVLRDSGEALLASGHHANPIARARRVRSAAQALRAQAEHQARRAKKNLGLT
jgi:hypothetical protein